MSESARPLAVLVAVRLPDTDMATSDASLDELERLVTTLGYTVTARVVQARPSLAAAAVIGEGKLQELAQLTGGTGSTHPVLPLAQREKQDTDEREARNTPDPPIALVAVDHDISPSQLRNLERACGVPVLDRSGTIIEIFHRHARSREAKLQVEIARLSYESPRLRESPRGKEKQHLRGSGDSALEIDRRRIRDRIAELRRELTAIAREQAVRRQHRPALGAWRWLVTPTPASPR
jgi:GTPase